MRTATDSPDAVEPDTFHLGYRPALDGLRAIAVVLVMLHHTAAFLWPSAASSFATGGFLGVDVFFVLSGFLITVILLDTRRGFGLVGRSSGEAGARALGAFYLRRVRRLVPALVGMLAFLGVCALVFHTPTWPHYRTTVGWVLSYCSNWGVLSTYRLAPEVQQIWSLAIEGQFYLVWPLVTLAVLAAARGSRKALAGTAVAGIVAVAWWRAQAWHHSPIWQAIYTRSPARFDDLLVGCVAGVAVSSGWIRGRASGAWHLVLAGSTVAVVVLAFVVDAGTGWLYLGGLTGIAVLAALMVLGALFAVPSSAGSRLLASRPFTAVGRWSYSLYLWHFPIFFLLHEHQPGWNPAARTAAGWALAFAAATTSYRFVEQPFLRGGERAGSRGSVATS